MLNSKFVVGVDVGNVVSGVVGLLEGQIQLVRIMDNKEVFDVIMGCIGRYDSVSVVIEDIKPYAGNLSQQAIDTCKFIGQLTWRLDEFSVLYRMMSRSEVRKWVYDQHWELVIPMVNRKIEKRNAKNNDGKNRKPSFVYVDDGMVLKAMKGQWNIETPPPGKGYKHGLKSHTWQALALATCFAALPVTFSPLLPEKS